MKTKVVVNGKRIGQGFVTGRQALVDALGQVDTMAVRIGGIFTGRAALIAYLKNVRGAASTVKIVPTNESLRIEHGSLGMVELPQWKWIKPKNRAMVMADSVYLEVGDRDRYLPNVGALDLAKALEKALVITASDKDASSPTYTLIVLQGDGKNLHVRSTDTKRCTQATIPANVTGTGFIYKDEAKTMVKMLRKAKSARIDILTNAQEYRDNGQDKTVDVPYVVLLADSLKLECLPNHVKHPLTDGIPEHLVPQEHNVAGKFYLGAKEFSEILRSAGMVAMDDEDKDNAPVFITMRPGSVEFSSYVKNKDEKNELSMAVSVECESEGYGEVCMNIQLMLPVLKVFGNGSVEIGMPVSQTTAVTIKDNDGTMFLVMPMKQKKPQAEPELEPETEQSEPMPDAEVA